jgi:hypothetical protein
MLHLGQGGRIIHSAFKKESKARDLKEINQLGLCFSPSIWLMIGFPIVKQKRGRYK